MSQSIFRLTDDGGLQRLDATPYPNERTLQEYLERHYEQLLAGEQIDPDEPRRWLLIKREAQISHRAGPVRGWQLDHLFVDQEGVPTLVETKLSSNPEIRRTVVGQVVEYAASFAQSWDAERMRSAFEASHSAPTERLRALLLPDERDATLDDESFESDFWQRVDQNIQSGRIRLMVVSDRIPETLLTMIEFLNSDMRQCELLALELQHFESVDADGATVTRTIVPRLLGQSATRRKRTKKTRGHSDPGYYILEPVVERLEQDMGLRVTRRMFRKGWLRAAGVGDDKGWLIYQSRKEQTLNISYEGFEGDDARLAAAKQGLAALQLPPGCWLSQPIASDAPEDRWFRITMDGFDYDDRQRWDELRDKLYGCLEMVLGVVGPDPSS